MPSYNLKPHRFHRGFHQSDVCQGDLFQILIQNSIFRILISDVIFLLPLSYPPTAFKTLPEHGKGSGLGFLSWRHSAGDDLHWSTNYSRLMWNNLALARAVTAETCLCPDPPRATLMDNGITDSCESPGFHCRVQRLIFLVLDLTAASRSSKLQWLPKWPRGGSTGKGGKAPKRG